MIGNNLLKISLILILLNTLNARENPFVATETYNEERKNAISSTTTKVLDTSEPVKEKSKAINKTIKITKENDVVNKIPPAKEVIFEAKKEKKISKPTIVKSPEEIINLLSFITIKAKETMLSVESTYKLKQHFFIQEENKVVIDYKGKVNFYTQYNDIKISSEFIKATLGNHPKKGYFRVVIKTKDKLSNYKVIVNKKDIVTIVRATKPEVTECIVDNTPNGTILTQIDLWKNAWQKDDIKTYISFYDDNFTKTNGVDLKAFKKYKTRIFKLAKNKNITFKNIKISSYKSHTGETLFKVTMDEDYKASNHKFKGKKELHLKLQDNKISILTEK